MGHESTSDVAGSSEGPDPRESPSRGGDVADPETPAGDDDVRLAWEGWLDNLRHAVEPVLRTLKRYYVDRPAPDWPLLPANYMAGLARYVSPKAQGWVNLNVRKPKGKRAARQRLDLIRMIYKALAEEKEINYAIEP